MDLTPENKKHIDSMDYEGLLRKWRFAPCGDPWFQGETGDYWGQRMAERGWTYEHGIQCFSNPDPKLGPRGATMEFLITLLNCGSGKVDEKFVKTLDGLLKVEDVVEDAKEKT